MLANKRGLHVALWGLALQAALIALAIWLWVKVGATATWPTLWLTLLPAPMWLLTALLFYCRYLEDVEAEEFKQLAAAGGDADGLFAGEAESRPATKRRKWMEKWIVPISTLVGVCWHGSVAGGLMWWLLRAETFPSNAPTAIFACVGAAFAGFLLSRYVLGMAEAPAWRLLRAPASYLFTNTLVLAALAAVLGLEIGGSRLAGPIAAWTIAMLLGLVGLEMLANLILDRFRPRMPGVERRQPYDSRLLSFLASPGSIGVSVAEALNYQFGFEVSTSWFYRLLQRAFVPLVLTGAVIIWLLTGVVVVEQGEAYVVLHFGEPTDRVLTPRPAPYLTWPWPIDVSRRFETAKTHTLVLGVGGERTEEFVNGKRVYLWSAEHGPRNELSTLVAVPPRHDTPGGRGDSAGQKIPNVMLLNLVVTVHYRVRDPRKFGYDFTDAHKLLACVANREMVRYAASATLDERLPEGAAADRPQGIMSFGRGKAARDLQGLIAAAVGDRETARALGVAAGEAPAAGGLDLGVRILRVELTGSHPPKEAAPAFEDVIAAERERDRMRYEAQAGARRILAEVAGDGDLAWKLAQGIKFRNDLEDLRRLLDLKATPAALKAAAAAALDGAETEAERISKEIHYEQLLGRLTRTAATGPAPSAGGSGGADGLLLPTLQARQRAHVALLEQLVAEPDAARIRRELAEYDRQVAKLYRNAGGQAAVAMETARAYRWTAEFEERALVDVFPIELMVQRAAPHLYRVERTLDALSRGMRARRKYILAAARDNIQVWLNLEEQAPGVTELELK